MRKSNIFLTVILLIIISGCSKKIKEGAYISQNSELSFIELKSDGKLFMRNNEQEVVGKYAIQENILTLIFEGGVAKRIEIVLDTLKDKDDSKWVYWNGDANDQSFKDQLNTVQQKIKSEKARKNIEIDLERIAVITQQYYRKPVELGGGENLFVDLTPERGLEFILRDSKIDETNATYKISKGGTKGQVEITAKGMFVLPDGSHPTYVCEITPVNFKIKKLN